MGRGLNPALELGRPKRSLFLTLAALVATFALLALGAQAAHAASPKALILSDSVSVPGPPPAAASGESLEQYEAEQDGFTVTNVDGSTWDGMTAAQFAQYQVVIIGDPTCGGRRLRGGSVQRRAPGSRS